MAEFGLVHYNFPGTLEEFLSYAQKNGFSCTELMPSDVWSEKSNESFANARERAERVRDLLETYGVRAAAVAPGNDFILDDEDSLKAQVERMYHMAELARMVGTDLLRIDGGSPKPHIPVEKARYIDMIVKGISLCLEFVEKEGFRMALDNHGLVTNDADLQAEVIRQVGSKHVGANMDTMNYRWAGHDLDTVSRFYSTIAPYVMHTHFKDGIGSLREYQGTALGEGEIPLSDAVAALKDAGYQGPWLVEYEGKVPIEGFRLGLEWLQAHL